MFNGVKSLPKKSGNSISNDETSFPHIKNCIINEKKDDFSLNHPL